MEKVCEQAMPAQKLPLYTNNLRQHIYQFLTFHFSCRPSSQEMHGIQQKALLTFHVAISIYVTLTTRIIHSSVKSKPPMKVTLHTRKLWYILSE